MSYCLCRANALVARSDPSSDRPEWCHRELLIPKPPREPTTATSGSWFARVDWKDISLRLNRHFALLSLPAAVLTMEDSGQENSPTMRHVPLAPPCLNY